jgi:mono/diheme cytochrome c family protein
MLRSPALCCALVALLALGAAPPAARHPGHHHRLATDQVRPFLARHCLACHGEKNPKGNVRLDRLALDLRAKPDRDVWLAVLEQLSAGAMPPKSRPRPPESEVRALAGWVRRELAAVQHARRDVQGRVVQRRLNRVEYENTVRDLLGIDGDFKDLLALDSAMDGFDNVGAALHVSSFAMERYLEAAGTALDLAIANRPRPRALKKRYRVQDQHQFKHAGERVFRELPDGSVVLFTSSPWQAIWLSQFYPADRGHYRFRISVRAFQSGGKPVVFRVNSGGGGMAGKTHLVGYFDAHPDRETVIEFVDRMEPRTTIWILPYGLTSSHVVHKVGADKWTGPGLALAGVDVEGPLTDSWPPPGHRRLFGDLPQAPAPSYHHRDRVEVVSKAPDADAERILRAFLRRAFRRSVSDDDVKPFLALFRMKRAAGRSFEQAVRVALQAALVSPHFLYLREKPGPLDDFALASRLSYFLWSSMPDEELLALAGRGALGRPEALRGQVERMLEDPKAKAFAENFVGQWLNLRDIEFTEPSVLLYPEFDHLLKVSMVEETERFFAEVLRGDLSVTSFVASDFSMLNGRLARHYGIAGVEGRTFRKVMLPRDSHRGGMLTMASVLKVTANGTTTSPVTRGVWVLERILGTPAPRPPADVPSIEPDIRGATTIRQQLARHREIPSCAACHAKIDPLGFALESFDVIGGWREHYRTRGLGKPIVIDGRRMMYLQGPKVDPSGELGDGRRFRDINELKKLLLQDPDQLARALTVKLLTYATGAAPEKADLPEVDAVVLAARERKYGLRSLVHALVQSPLFRNK